MAAAPESALTPKLVEDGVLKVAMECAYAPFNWTQADASNGAVPISGTSDYAYGYDVMFAKKIAEHLGCELEIVKMEWDALIPALQSGSVDAVIAGQYITADRAAAINEVLAAYTADDYTAMMDQAIEVQPLNQE